MTVSVQTTYATYTGNGVTTVFAYQFKILSQTDLTVYVAGVAQVLGVNYTVAGVGVDAGGSITFISGAPAAAAAVSITRTMQAKRAVDYQHAGDFQSDTVNPDMDNPVLLIQDLQTQLGRSIRTPADEVGTLPVLPSITSRSGKYIAFDALGQPIASVGTGNDSALRSDLAITLSGTDGSRLVGFRRVGTGSVARTTQAKLADRIDVRDFGVVGNNTDEHLKFQAAIDAVSALGGGVLSVPTPASKYGLGTVGLSVPANVLIVGESCEQVIYNFTGAGTAFTFVNGGNGLINAYVETTAAAGTAFNFGNDSRRSALIRVTAQCTFAPASGRTSTGLLLSTTAAAAAFSGNMVLDQVYLLGYKYGWDWNCFELANRTWTTVVATQLFINGPGAGVCAGSRGIRMNATTNGVGSYIFGGTLEGCEAPIEVANGGFGISYYGDIEGNTSDVPILGLSACGVVEQHPAGGFYRVAANNAVNRWMGERHLTGDWTREVRTAHSFLFYDDSLSAAFFTIYRGASLINGGSPSVKWQFATGNSGADNGANRNYLQGPNGSRMYFGTGSPEAVVTANPGSWYGRDNGGALTSFYVKESGVGNVGWIAK